jgi:hypothetical protein
MPNDHTFFRTLATDFATVDDASHELLLREYGAVFVARNVIVPDRVVFADEDEVSAFQSRLETASARLGDFEIELQRAAMDALLEARSEAESNGLSITPRGADSGRRNYAGTVELWKSRVEPALKHWVEKGRLTEGQAESLRSLSPFEQVPEVLSLESEGIYFAKDLSKSIIYSVAPPGASQHLSMLAFDVAEFDDARVRAILAKHHWYQTVTSDLPHFTFLGVEAGELAGLGLKRVTSGDREFWVPDI